MGSYWINFSVACLSRSLHELFFFLVYYNDDDDNDDDERKIWTAFRVLSLTPIIQSQHLFTFYRNIYCVIYGYCACATKPFYGRVY